MLATVLAVALATPGSALAHGIHGEAETIEFIWLGVRPMALGWDHLLFIAGIVLLAGRRTVSSRRPVHRDRRPPLQGFVQQPQIGVSRCLFSLPVLNRG